MTLSQTGTPTPALYSTKADAARAVARAKRWLRNKSRSRDDKPPFHILFNATLADKQFG